MLEDKKVLRKQLIEKRKAMSAAEKSVADEVIFSALIDDQHINSAEIILCYVSMEIEVDTVRFINYCLENNKRVAVPKCEGEFISFYEIFSLDELKPGFFDILEPQNDKKIYKFENSVCIVPALCYDINNYRIGYGKGFYDRFLKNYSGFSIGIIYKNFIGNVYNDENDVPVNIVISG